MNEIIIKCFKTPKNYYFYDRCTNSVVKVNSKEYSVLKQVEKEGKIPLDESCLNKYIENGVLQKK